MNTIIESLISPQARNQANLKWFMNNEKNRVQQKRAGWEDATDRNKFHSYIKAYSLCGHLKKLFKKIIFLICVYSGTFEKV